MKAIKIALEGNIGSGKTTLLAELQKDPRITTFPEPITEWRNEPDGFNYLDMYYKEPNRYAYLFQTRTLTSLIKRNEQPFSSPIAIYERSIHATRIFQKWCLSQNYISAAENDNLIFMEKTLVKETPNVLFYLRTTPAKCLGRVLARGRPEERSVNLEFLTQINQYHEEWISEANLPTFILNGQQNPTQVLNQTLEIINRLDLKNQESLLPTNLLG